MSLNASLLEVVALPARVSPEFNNDLMYGIELEYERMNRAGEPPTYWTATTDGSIRNGGMEYVSQTLSRQQLPQAIDNIGAFLSGYNPDPHPRCGIHVHLNMRPRTIGELYSFLATYILLEPSIFQQWCPERLLSSFCVPVYQNDLMLYRAFQSIQMARRNNIARPLNNLISTSKYSAMNMASIGRFGTAECRILPATTDMGRLSGWVEMLTRLYDMSTQYQDPRMVVNEYEDRGLRHFQRDYLGETTNIPERQQNQAVVAATFISGFEEQDWQDLNWEQQENN